MGGASIFIKPKSLQVIAKSHPYRFRFCLLFLNVFFDNDNNSDCDDGNYEYINYQTKKYLTKNKYLTKERVQKIKRKWENKINILN